MQIYWLSNALAPWYPLSQIVTHSLLRNLTKTQQQPPISIYSAYEVKFYACMNFLTDLAE